MDSRNHGSSRYVGAPTDSASSASRDKQKLDMSIPTLAADAAALLSHLGADGNKAIVIGHSLGGIVATVLCHSYTQLIRGLVLIDPSYLLPPGAFDGFIAKLCDPERTASETVALITGFFDAVYPPDTPEYIKTWHAMRVWGMEQSVAVAAWPFIVDYVGSDNVEFIRRTHTPGVPRLVVTSVPPFLEPLRQAGSETPEMDDFEPMEGGHWMMKTKADEFNEVLAKWLDKHSFK